MVESSPKAGIREWAGLAVLVLPLTLISVDMSVLFIALPALAADLRPTSTQMLWILDIYTFLLAGLLITMGALGDRIGRRRLLMLGVTAFGAASLVAAYAPSAELLIAARALLGVGGATLMPSTLALIRNIFHDPRQRQTAIGIWTAGLSGGIVLGPLLGGTLLEHFWWGSVFLINVLVMAPILVAAPLLLPESRDPSPGRYDLVSAALSLAAVLPVVYGVKRLAADGFAWAPALAIVAGLLLGLAFVRRQRLLPDPMIDVGLFRVPTFSAVLTVNALATFAVMGASVFTTQYLLSVLGFRPLVAGLWSVPSGVATMVGAVLAAAAVRRFRPGRVLATGPLLAALGLLLVSRVEADSGLAVLVPGTILMGLGVGVVIALAVDMVVASVRRERAGIASAMSETASEFGSALGIAVLGTIGTAVYRREMANLTDTTETVGTLLPGLPEGVAESARETVAAAVELAGRLPAPAGPELLAAAREAFTQGVQVTMQSAAGVLVGSAVLAAFLLRDASAGAGEEREAAGRSGSH